MWMVIFSARSLHSVPLSLHFGRDDSEGYFEKSCGLRVKLQRNQLSLSSRPERSESGVESKDLSVNALIRQCEIKTSRSFDFVPLSLHFAQDDSVCFVL